MLRQNKATSVSVSFGQLGSYTYNSPKLLPTPPQNLPPPPSQMSSKDTSYVYKLSKEECMTALDKWVSDQCCKAKKPVKEGHLGDVYSYNALEVRVFLGFFNKIY